MIKIILCLGTLWGCTFLRETIGLVPTQPKVGLEQITVNGFSWEKIDLLAQLKVQNPNNFSIDLKALTYKVELGQSLVADGRYDKPLSIPSLGAAHVTLPIRIHSSALVNIIEKNTKKLNEQLFRLLAKVTFDTTIGPMSMNFEETKKVSDFLR